MKIRLLHPITHDGVHYSRGIHELDDSTAQALLDVHSPECTSFEAPRVKQVAGIQVVEPEKPNGQCRNHSAVPFIEINPVMGTASPAPDARKPDLSKAPSEANIPEAPTPDSSGDGTSSPAPDAPKKNGRK